MKRSKNIDLAQMRLAARRAPGQPIAQKQAPPLRKAVSAPLALLMSASCFMACAEEEQEVQIVASVEECVQRGTLSPQECETAYMKAVAEAERTGPRYNSRASCEAEYGYSRCRGGSGGIFMPMMAGFMIGNMMGGRSYNPVYRYGGYDSRLNGSYVTAGGKYLGRPGQSSYRVPSSGLKPRGRTVRTSSRGGFGSVSSAKSSWGTSRSSRRWGG